MSAKSRYMKIEVVGPVILDGEVRWKVIVHWLDGDTQTYVFATEEEALAFVKEIREGFERLKKK